MASDGLTMRELRDEIQAAFADRWAKKDPQLVVGHPDLAAAQHWRACTDTFDRMMDIVSIAAGKPQTAVSMSRAVELFGDRV